MLLAMAVVVSVVGAFFGAAYAHRFACHSDYFRVRRVEVRGASEHLEADARAWLAEHFEQHGGNLYRLNRALIAQGLHALPRARSVHVRKAYPQRLRIAFEERLPTAVVNLDRPYLMDREGVLLAPADDESLRDPYCPILTGIHNRLYRPGDRVEQARLTGVLDAVGFLVESDRALAARIVEWHIDGRDEVTAIMVGGAEVRFGMQAPLALLDKLSGALQIKRDLATADYIDLRMDRQIVYRFEPSGQTGALVP